MDFSKIEDAFSARGRDGAEYGAAYRELLERAKPYESADPGGTPGDVKRIREFSLVVLQVLLHRATKLFAGALSALLDENAYSMALSIRGHFETTAVLGYLHYRLHSLSKRNISSEAVDQDICRLILGSRDKGILKLNTREDFSAESKNILSMLQYADASVSRHVLDGKEGDHDMLTDSYNFLCEFSHPNFHSNAAAFELKKEEKRFYFRHNGVLTANYFGLIDYLMISHPIFIVLFDQVPGLLPRQ